MSQFHMKQQSYPIHSHSCTEINHDSYSLCPYDTLPYDNIHNYNIIDISNCEYNVKESTIECPESYTVTSCNITECKCIQRMIKLSIFTDKYGTTNQESRKIEKFIKKCNQFANVDQDYEHSILYHSTERDKEQIAQMTKDYEYIYEFIRTFQIENKFMDKQCNYKITTKDLIWMNNKMDIMYNNNIKMEQLQIFTKLPDSPKLIQIKIKHPYKGSHIFEVFTSITLQKFHEKIRDFFKIDTNDSFSIGFNGHKTECNDINHDQCTLKKHGIGSDENVNVYKPDCQESNLSLLSSVTPCFNLIVQQNVIVMNMTNGNLITILKDINPTQTIKDIKLRLQKEIRVWHEIQSIYYYGKELKDDNQALLAIVGVEGNAMIYLLTDYINNPLLSTFNESLCDNDITKYNLDIDSLGFKHKVMTPWNNSCISPVEGICLNLKMVYKINKNYKQNEDIYNALISTKKMKIKGYPNEEILFHGTSTENIIKIINSGFNRDYNIRGAYGRGTYFSNQATIASKYCKKIGNNNHNNNTTYYAMLACKTYIGISTIGRQYMNRDELYMNDKVTQYDSLVNDLLNPVIYVINRDYHAIPCFILIFTRNLCNGC